MNASTLSSYLEDSYSKIREIAHQNKAYSDETEQLLEQVKKDIQKLSESNSPESTCQLGEVIFL